MLTFLSDVLHYTQHETGQGHPNFVNFCEVCHENVGIITISFPLKRLIKTRDLPHLGSGIRFRLNIGVS